MSFFNDIKIRNIPSCVKCGLDRQCKSPRITLAGKGKKKILIIGGAPGSDDDEYNQHLVGDSGSALRKKLRKIGLDLDKDFWAMHSVNCRPINFETGNNRKPTPKEIACCNALIKDAVEKCKPKSVVVMGGTALRAWFHDIKLPAKSDINTWRGQKIHDSRYNVWVYPINDPFMLVQYKNNKLFDRAYTQDLQNIFNNIKSKSPVFNDPKKCIKILTEFSNVKKLLKHILIEEPLISFDYETTGLKPQKKGHRIASIGVAISSTEAYAFPFQHPHWEIKHRKIIVKLWRQILLTKTIKKIIHNYNFDIYWSHVLLKLKVCGVVWDTMTTAHIHDERLGHSKLKFQLFCRYGIQKYSSPIVDKYLKSDTPNGINEVFKIPLPELLPYNAMDALGTLWLYYDQYKIKRFRAPSKFILLGSEELCLSQQMGLPVKKKYYQKKSAKLTIRIEKLTEKLLTSKEALKYKQITGEVLDLNSPKVLSKLFYEYLKYKPYAKTAKDGGGANKEALMHIGTPFAKRLNKYRTANGTNNYLKGILRECIDGAVHPFFHLHTTRTMRSSSSEINFQNMPSRNEKASALVRGGFYPLPGHFFSEADYESMEVKGIACYSKDKKLIWYLNQPENNMHKDAAGEVFMLDSKLVTSKIRFVGKNGWVFAQFYGSYYISCAERIWPEVFKLKLEDGTPLIKHLNNKGIHSLNDFKDHLQKVEKVLWNRFSGVKKWQEKTIAHYMETGEVETFFGFVRRHDMSNNKIINSPIQGTSFLLLLWAYNRLAKQLRRDGWKTKVAGQIHDSIVSFVWPEEKDEYYALLKKVMCDDLCKEFSWINVPMGIELKESEEDKPWSTIKKVCLPHVYN